MKELIIYAFSQMKWRNMEKVHMNDFKYVSNFLIRKLEQEEIADKIYDFCGYGYDANYQQNIRPLVEELEDLGYIFDSDFDIEDACILIAEM